MERRGDIICKGIILPMQDHYQKENNFRIKDFKIINTDIRKKDRYTHKTLDVIKVMWWNQFSQSYKSFKSTI